MWLSPIPFTALTGSLGLDCYTALDSVYDHAVLASMMDIMIDALVVLHPHSPLNGAKVTSAHSLGEAGKKSNEVVMLAGIPSCKTSLTSGSIMVHHSLSEHVVHPYRWVGEEMQRGGKGW